MTLVTGTVIAGYRIEALIGSGSTGSVYSAEDVALERRVALKVLAPELARDERFRERFLRESRLAAALEHPHVVPIHAAGETDGDLFLAMRYVDGRDLAALLRSLGRLDPERVLSIAAQVAGSASTRRTPTASSIATSSRPTSCSRGTAVPSTRTCATSGSPSTRPRVSSLTGERDIVGTVDYLAPEQIEGRPVDGRTDVYALGCVLFECLTGEPPFDRDNELASLLAHRTIRRRCRSERIAELPEALDAVLARALAKDRDDRLRDRGELVAAARAAFAGEAPAPASASPPGPLRCARSCSPTSAATRRTCASTATRPARRWRSASPRSSRPRPDVPRAPPRLRGDEALVVFDSARPALRFAVALRTARRGGRAAAAVGIGLDAGEAVPVEEGFRGGALNRAARLCALAKPGEVLASDAVVELAGRGRRRLRLATHRAAQGLRPAGRRGRGPRVRRRPLAASSAGPRGRACSAAGLAAASPSPECSRSAPSGPSSRSSHSRATRPRHLLRRRWRPSTRKPERSPAASTPGASFSRS